MPEVGQTILYVDAVGFQRMPDLQEHDFAGRPILPKKKQYGILLQDTQIGRTYVVPINDEVRKQMIENMRQAPLEVVTQGDNGHAS